MKKEILFKYSTFIFSVLLITVLYIHKTPGSFEKVDLHIDETYWIGESYYFNLFFIEHNLTHYSWNGFWSMHNPPFIKYYYGAALYFNNIKVDDFSLRDMFDEYWADKEALRNKFPLDHLIICRKAAWLSLLFTLFIVFAIPCNCGRPLCGVFAVVIFVNDLEILVYFSRALSEPPFTLIIMAYMFSAMLLFKKNIDKKNKINKQLYGSMLILLTSVIIGLAALTKLNGPLLGVIFVCQAVVFFMLKTYYHDFEKEKNNKSRYLFKNVSLFALLVIIVGVLSICIAILFNPYLYNAPFEKVLKSLNAWNQMISRQQANFEVGLITVKEKLSYFFNNCYFIGNVNTKAVNIINHAFLALGFLFVFTEGVNKTREKKSVSSELLFGVASVIWLSVHIFWLPLAWKRYLVPLVPFVAIFQAAGLYFIMVCLLKLLKADFILSYIETKKA